MYIYLRVLGDASYCLLHPRMQKSLRGAKAVTVTATCLWRNTSSHWCRTMACTKVYHLVCSRCSECKVVWKYSVGQTHIRSPLHIKTLFIHTWEEVNRRASWTAYWRIAIFAHFFFFFFAFQEWPILCKYSLGGWLTDTAPTCHGCGWLVVVFSRQDSQWQVFKGAMRHAKLTLAVSSHAANITVSPPDKNAWRKISPRHRLFSPNIVW